jgi:hypothetical protein
LFSTLKPKGKSHMPTKLAITVIVSLVSANSLVATEPGPSKDIPELAPLNNWAGDWTGTVEKPARPSGLSHGKWIVDGRYLQQTWKIPADDNSPGLSATVIMTYDAKEKIYRNWQFLSDGGTSQATGQWDAKKSTMTWTANNPDGVTVVTKARFPDADLQLWTITATNRSGQTLFEMSGNNKRRKN